MFIKRLSLIFMAFVPSSEVLANMLLLSLGRDNHSEQVEKVEKSNKSNNQNSVVLANDLINKQANEKVKGNEVKQSSLPTLSEELRKEKQAELLSLQKDLEEYKKEKQELEKQKLVFNSSNIISFNIENQIQQNPIEPFQKVDFRLVVDFNEGTIFLKSRTPQQEEWQDNALGFMCHYLSNQCSLNFDFYKNDAFLGNEKFVFKTNPNRLEFRENNKGEPLDKDNELVFSSQEDTLLLYKWFVEEKADQVFVSIPMFNFSKVFLIEPKKQKSFRD